MVTQRLPVLVQQIISPTRLVHTNVNFRFNTTSIRRQPGRIPIARHSLTQRDQRPSRANTARRTGRRNFDLVIAILNNRRRIITLHHLGRNTVAHVSYNALRTNAKLGLRTRSFRQRPRTVTSNLAVHQPHVDHQLRAIISVRNTRHQRNIKFYRVNGGIRRSNKVRSTKRHSTPIYNITP